MLNQSYIKISSILGVIHSMINKETYFNSENHFITTTSSYLGLSPKRTRLYYNQFKEEGLLSFDNQQVKSSSKTEEVLTPQYILATQKIQDKRYWLRQREYEILCYLSNKKNQLHYVFSKENIKRADEVLYLCSETIATDTGYTIDQVRYSMNKISLYFEDFWKDPSKFDLKGRYHKRSHSKTITLPKRKQWKYIIEAKVLEMTNLSKSDLVPPVLIDKAKKKQFDKKKEVWGTLVAYSNMLTHNKKQAVRLKEGKDKFQELKAAFRICCLFEIDPSIKEEINDLIGKIRCSRENKQPLIRLLEEKLSPLLC